MVRLNCWKVKNCGRMPGGSKVAEMGICPASVDTSSNGLNGGTNGGRICWAVTGTFCGGQVQGTFAQKELSCMNCEFFKHVKGEEGKSFLLLRPQQAYKKHETVKA
ncbi:MAG: hypothetical protein HY677_06365 [Chloroflexi bacterium]|nr:hypothetical protein [Chloroflexota bacterium]